MRLPRFPTALVIAALMLMSAGCATVDVYSAAPIAQHLERDDAIGRCARLYRDIDQRIDRAGVRDGGAPRVAGWPYLRVDRALAALAQHARTPEQQARWLAHAAREDDDARGAELSNAALLNAAGSNSAGLNAEGLNAEGSNAAEPNTALAVPGSAAPVALDGAAVLARLQRCRNVLADADRHEQAPELPKSVSVPDDYSVVARTLGVYPLARIPFAFGVRRWQRDTEAVFAQSAVQAPVAALQLHYVLPSAVPFSPTEMVRDALDVPLPTAAQRRDLLAVHAPRWIVNTATADDRIGMVLWGTDGGLAVDTKQPTVDTQFAWMRFDGRLLPQLIYTVWFPRRPAQGSFDLLAGEIDGLMWRVTLDTDGTPLLYDSIHPCGCYHQFFPSDRLLPRPAPDTLDEGAFMPLKAPLVPPRKGEQIALWVASSSHYLQYVAVLADAAARRPGDVFPVDASRTVVLQALPASRLRMLPRLEPRLDPRLDPRLEPSSEHAGSSAAAATRSAFAPNGLMLGTERAERLFFWPMGIASAGQMRQWGRQATAFVGRRHYDDADLLDRYFTRAVVQAEPPTDRP